MVSSVNNHHWACLFCSTGAWDQPERGSYSSGTIRLRSVKKKWEVSAKTFQGSQSERIRVLKCLGYLPLF